MGSDGWQWYTLNNYPCPLSCQFPPLFSSVQTNFRILVGPIFSVVAPQHLHSRTSLEHTHAQKHSRTPTHTHTLTTMINPGEQGSEVISLSFGHYSTNVSAHFWNSLKHVRARIRTGTNLLAHSQHHAHEHQALSFILATPTT